jgi:hypothetical protein
MDLTLKEFLERILAMDLTMNEMSVLIEMGHLDFSREDLLNSGRCDINTYSAPALTRTLQKLSAKNPAIITSYLNSNKKITYRLIDKCEPYAKYEPLLLSIARTRVLTVNTMRVALQMILNKNKVSTTRFLAKQLNLDADYLGATVLPRMIIIGLLENKLINPKEYNDINLEEQDKTINRLHGVFLDLKWEGVSKITLL